VLIDCFLYEHSLKFQLILIKYIMKQNLQNNFAGTNAMS